MNRRLHFFVAAVMTIWAQWAIGYSININPASGDTLGAYPITISGVPNPASVTQVLIGGADCNNIQVNSTEVNCLVPAGTGDQPVLVYSDATQVFNNNSHIFAYQPPMPFQVTPNTVAQTGGTPITVSGSNFGPEPGQVLVGGVDCFILSHNESSIDCFVPAGRGSDKPVTVIQSNGKSATLANALSYQACAPGTFYSNGQCLSCAVGTYQDEADQDSCKMCEPGTFNAATGATQCNACSVGSFAASFGSAQCNLCPQGRFQDQTGQAQCMACPLGTFNDQTGASSCSACAIGQFGNAIGQTSCSDCPVGVAVK